MWADEDAHHRRGNLPNPPPLPAHLHQPPESLDIAAVVILRAIYNKFRQRQDDEVKFAFFGHSAGSFTGVWLTKFVKAIGSYKAIHKACVSGLNFPPQILQNIADLQQM